MADKSISALSSTTSLSLTDSFLLSRIIGGKYRSLSISWYQFRNTIQSYVNSLMSNSEVIWSIYPVGSIYITTDTTCPLASIITGSVWEKISSGRFIVQSDSDSNLGKEVAAVDSGSSKAIKMNIFKRTK